MPKIKRTMVSRQMHGAMFGEDAVLVKKTTSWDSRGRPDDSEVRSSIRLATNPLSPRDPRVGMLTEGGTKLEDLRIFFTSVEVDPKERDEIVFEGERYTIITTARYGDGHSESIGSRVEVQS